MSMDVEVSVAWNFVISYLYNKLPRRRVDCFGEELEKGLKLKFNGHWYPDMPFKGSAFRCVKFNGVAADPLVEEAAVNSGMNIEEVRDYLPNELTLWIDPKEVSYRIGEKGLVKILYSDKKEEFPCEATDCEVQSMNGCFNPEVQSFRPIETLSASMSSLNLSPVDGSSPTSPWGSPSPTNGLQSSGNSPINNPFIPAQRTQQQQQKFTAAMFAQTKFGSTKLKSNAKRPNRLSPTDFGGFVKQRSVLQSHWINGVGAVSPVGAAGYHAMNGFPAPNLTYPAAQIPAPLGRGRQSLSPRDPRQDLINQQQQMMLLQQQHLQLQQQQQQQQNQLHKQTALPSGLPSPTAAHGCPSELSSDLFPLHTPTSSSNAFFSCNPTPSHQPACISDNTPLNNKTPASDLGLQGIMGRLASSQSEENMTNGGQVKSGLNNENATWGSMSSPYASLQHLLVAN